MSRRFPIVALATALMLGCTPGGGEPSGTYEAKDAQTTMTIDFKSGHKFHMTMQEGANPAESADGDFMMEGDKITLQVPNGMPVVLVRNGKALETNLMGQVLHFEKK